MALVKEIIFTVLLFSIIPVAFAQEYPEYGVKVETVAENLTIPWSIDWTPDGTIFFTERNGNLRVIEDGVLVNEPILSLGVGGVEGGMLGVTVDPKYSDNNYIYLYYTYNEFLSTSNKVVRYLVTDGIVTGAFALCKIKVVVFPKNISFGKPSPHEPMTI